MLRVRAVELGATLAEREQELALQTQRVEAAQAETEQLRAQTSQLSALLARRDEVRWGAAAEAGGQPELAGARPTC